MVLDLWNPSYSDEYNFTILLFNSPGYYFNINQQNKGSASNNVAYYSNRSKPEGMPLV